MHATFSAEIARREAEGALGCRSPLSRTGDRRPRRRGQAAFVHIAQAYALLGDARIEAAGCEPEDALREDPAYEAIGFLREHLEDAFGLLGLVTAAPSDERAYVLEREGAVAFGLGLAAKMNASSKHAAIAPIDG